MILIEFKPPFQCRPSLWRQYGCWRAMWGWLAVAYVPYDLNGLLTGILSCAPDDSAPGVICGKSTTPPTGKADTGAEGDL